MPTSMPTRAGLPAPAQPRRHHHRLPLPYCYCTVMLGDAVNARKAVGEAKQSLEVIDVAQFLARAVRLREVQDQSRE
jgi:hypothetical protein